MALNLTVEESVAKNYFLNLWAKGYNIPSDSAFPENEPDLPSWFDPVKYQRGREFFFKNKWSILESNLVGLICLLADSTGLEILSMTGKSSTPEEAYKRYSSTVMHTLSWYYVDLTPNSKSKISLKRVRRAHYNASIKAENSKLGIISQPMMSLTAFGFMGFPLLYPNTMGLIDNTKENMEGFVHFWAIICYILGVNDEFNMCLLPVESVRVVGQMMIRYLFIPNMQAESPLFKSMVTAMLTGVKQFLPIRKTEFYLPLSKVYCQVPGYHVCISELDKPICKSIFSQNELDDLLRLLNSFKGEYSHFPTTTKIPVIRVCEKSIESEMVNNNEIAVNSPDYNFVVSHMKLKDAKNVHIEYIEFEEEGLLTFDKKCFESLDFEQRFLIKTMFAVKKIYKWSSVIRWMLDYLFDISMKKQFGKYTENS